MEIFSETSRILIFNWESVQDILKAKQKLHEEISRFLHSLKQDLEKTNWWNTDWVFVGASKEEIYVTKKDWQRGNNNSVWIGIEGFNPNSLFGDDTNATLYVWVHQCSDLVNDLLREFDEKSDCLIGEMDRRKNPYVIKKAFKQFLPEELNDFETIARNQILEFITHYALILQELNPVIKRYNS